MPLRSIALRATSPAVRLWWRIREPTTFGVKVLLAHPDDPRCVLVVRHAYGGRDRWALPGGGYRPAHETPHQAAGRELAEEVGLEVDPASLSVLDTVVTTLEGKRDTLTLLTGRAPAARFVISPELAEARWVGDVTELGDAPVSRWLLAALALRDELAEPDSGGCSSP